MLRFNSAILILIFPLSILHAATYEDQDKFKKTFHEESGSWGGFTGENELQGGRFLSLVPGKSTSKDNNVTYKLKIRWTGPELLLINHANLILIVDGLRIELHPSKEFTQHLIDTEITSDNNDVYERVDYEVDKDLLKNIAAAKQVECALYTPRGRLERYLGKSNLKQFKEFSDKVLKNN